MARHDVIFSSGRNLIFSSSDDPLDDSLHGPFATLVPAFDEGERQQAEAMTGPLIDRGCLEFCCVGPEAEQLHDSIDAIVEERGALEVVTTWHTDHSDACDHFLYAAGGVPSILLALISSHPELAALLEREAQSE